MIVDYIPKQFLHLFNHKEQEQARALQRMMLEETDNTIEEMAEMAASIVFGHGGCCVLRSSAYIAPNCRITYNHYGVGTGDFDIMIDVIATNRDDFFSEVADIEVCLSDLLGYHNNREEVINHMTIHKFKEVE